MFSIAYASWLLRRLPFWLAGAALMLGEANADMPALPAAPASGLRDDTRALPEASRLQMEALLQAGREELHADLWLNAGTFVEAGQTLQSQSRQLRQHWSGKRDAMLVNFDRATGQIALSLSPGIWERYPTAALISLLQRTLSTDAGASKQPEVRLLALVQQLKAGFGRLEQQRHVAAQTFSSAHRSLAQGFALSLAGGSVLLLVLGVWVRRRAAQDGLQAFFPQVHVGLRLGAPHGGGVMAGKEGRGGAPVE